ncbi:hypothetical protein [Candidatus Macondimonas diazotrophica]|uniref:Uncharacterized protein n=1 Tax=Candidatus Macondimonas diazotrophica TaxID=2305248 RepID=A0A4Z0F4M6_9GAMM|nr:hypothetical protein [Candidatus Macondimonas diazotrophica]TFZ81244.1 hypothetical protein E4680_13265 [Candidatus Macondimonas diazotrophica]
MQTQKTNQKNKPTAAPAEIILYRAVSLARRLMDENPDMQPDKATSIASMSGNLDGYWRARVFEWVTSATIGCNRRNAQR